MNLAYKYPILYWNAANLIVDSGSAGIEDNLDLDDDELDELELTSKKKKNKGVDYGKISTAIGKMKSRGINVALPDINLSDFTFTPICKDNTIRYGIKGITRISHDLVRQIISNRPYFSMDLFLSKVKINKSQMINLIKSGCFDKIEKRAREEIIERYIIGTLDLKTKLTLQNMPSLIKENVIPLEMKEYEYLFNFNKHLKTCKKGIYYILNLDLFDFFSKRFDIDGLYLEDGIPCILQKDWDKLYKKAMLPMRDYLKDEVNGMTAKINNSIISSALDKDAKGTRAKWEMDSVGFYYSYHELKLDYDLGSIFGISILNFRDLSLISDIASTFTTKDGSVIPIYKLHHIIGTVIGKNKAKHTVTLLCNDLVVNVKVWDSQFTKYDKQISAIQEDGHKKVIEKSWFTRGKTLLFTGIRRGNSFVPKIYKSTTLVNSPIILIDLNHLMIDSRCDDL